MLTDKHQPQNKANSNQRPASRSISHDLIKTFSIFGVVLIHSVTMLDLSSGFTEYLAWLFRFCVPSFIIIWAYFFERSYSRKSTNERWIYLYKRYYQLLKPFIIWSTIYLLLFIDWNKATIITTITSFFLGYGFPGQYFFIILFQLIILYPIIRWFYKKQFWRYTLLFIIIITYFIWNYNYENLPLFLQKVDDRFFFLWIPYVFAGIYLSKKGSSKKSLAWSLILLLIPIEFHFLKTNNISHSPYITFAVLLSSIIMSISLINNRKIVIKSTRVVNLIHYIGKNSIIIFVANPLIIYIFKLLNLKYIFGVFHIHYLTKYLSQIFITLIIFITCIALAVTIDKLNLSKLLK